MLSAAGAVGEVFNIGAGEEHPNIEIARKIVALTARTQSLLAFRRGPPRDDWRYSLDSRKIRALGWRPRVDFDEGLERTVRWYARNALWWKPIKEGSFKRYYAKLHRSRSRSRPAEREKVKGNGRRRAPPELHEGGAPHPRVQAPPPLRESLVHTGQTTTRTCRRVLPRSRAARADIHLGVGSGSHAEQTGRIMIAFEEIVARERPISSSSSAT